MAYQSGPRKLLQGKTHFFGTLLPGRKPTLQPARGALSACKLYAYMFAQLGYGMDASGKGDGVATAVVKGKTQCNSVNITF